MIKNNRISRLKTIQNISFWIMATIGAIHLFKEEWLGGGLFKFYLMLIAVICAGAYLYLSIKIPHEKKDKQLAECKLINTQKDKKIEELQAQIEKS